MLVVYVSFGNEHGESDENKTRMREKKMDMKRKIEDTAEKEWTSTKEEERKTPHVIYE